MRGNKQMNLKVSFPEKTISSLFKSLFDECPGLCIIFRPAASPVLSLFPKHSVYHSVFFMSSVSWEGAKGLMQWMSYGCRIFNSPPRVGGLTSCQPGH